MSTGLPLWIYGDQRACGAPDPATALGHVRLIEHADWIRSDRDPCIDALRR